MSTNYRSQQHVYRMFGGPGPDLMLAQDADEAWEMWCQASGENRADYDEEAGWERLDHDVPVMIGTEDVDDMLAMLNEAAAAGSDPCEARLTARAGGADFLAHGWMAYYIEAPASWWARMPLGVLLLGDW